MNNGPMSSDGSNRSAGPGANLIPVYCAIFGAIIVSLILYVIVKRWKLCPRDRKKPLTASKASNNPQKQMKANNNQGDFGLLPVYSTQSTGRGYLIPLNYQQPLRVSNLMKKSPKKQSLGSNLSSHSGSTATESQKLCKLRSPIQRFLYSKISISGTPKIPWWTVPLMELFSCIQKIQLQF